MIGLDCDGFDLVQDQTVLRNEFTISMYNAESVQSALMALLAEPGEDRRLG
jgi:hypothetical protein